MNTDLHVIPSAVDPLAPPAETGEPITAAAECNRPVAHDHVRQNPVPIILGALALGVAIGYMLMSKRRREPTFRERFVEDPMHGAREAIQAALAPLTHRMHDQYDLARNGAGKTIDKMKRYHPSHSAGSWTDPIRRAGSSLGLW